MPEERKAVSARTPELYRGEKKEGGGGSLPLDKGGEIFIIRVLISDVVRG